MQKNYIAPQTEVMQFSSQLMQDSMAVVHHSGGSGNGGSGSFDEDYII